MGRPGLLLRSQTWEVLEMKLTTGGAIRIRRTYLCTYMRVCQYCKLCRNATETYSPQILGRSWETGKRQLEVLGSPTDCINSVGSSTRVDFGYRRPKAREKGADYDHYRRGLSSELSTNCVFD